jgi:hypothetical protein
LQMTIGLQSLVDRSPVPREELCSAVRLVFRIWW